MSGELNISLSSEILDSGPEEERATFGLLSMTANDRLLTEGIDADSNEVRPTPLGLPVGKSLCDANRCVQLRPEDEKAMRQLVISEWNQRCPAN